MCVRSCCIYGQCWCWYDHPVRRAEGTCLEFSLIPIFGSVVHPPQNRRACGHATTPSPPQTRGDPVNRGVVRISKAVDRFLLGIFVEQQQLTHRANFVFTGVNRVSLRQQVARASPSPLKPLAVSWRKTSTYAVKCRMRSRRYTWCGWQYSYRVHHQLRRFHLNQCDVSLLNTSHWDYRNKSQQRIALSPADKNSGSKP